MAKINGEKSIDEVHKCMKKLKLNKRRLFSTQQKKNMETITNIDIHNRFYGFYLRTGWRKLTDQLSRVQKLGSRCDR